MSKQMIEGKIFKIGDNEGYGFSIIEVRTTKEEIMKLTKNIIYKKVKITFEEVEE